MIEKIRKEVLNRLDQTRELADEEIWRCIDEVVVQFSKREYLPLPKRSQVRKGVFDSLRRLDILQELLEDDEITEIMVNGCEDIFVERQGSRKIGQTFYFPRTLVRCYSAYGSKSK